jgi:hypothetical protein
MRPISKAAVENEINVMDFSSRLRHAAALCADAVRHKANMKNTENIKEWRREEGRFPQINEGRARNHSNL